MIEFKRKYAMQNGNKVTKKNWQHVFAVSSEPCTNIHGNPVIEAAKENGGAYYEKWKLVFEPADPLRKEDKPGYIFREINHKCGINGKHATPKQAIWWATGHRHISVFLEDQTTVPE